MRDFGKLAGSAEKSRLKKSERPRDYPDHFGGLLDELDFVLLRQRLSFHALPHEPQHDPRAYRNNRVRTYPGRIHIDYAADMTAMIGILNRLLCTLRIRRPQTGEVWLKTDEWAQVTAVHDGQTMRLYVNGVQHV